MAKKIEKLDFKFYLVTETNSLAHGTKFRKRGFNVKMDAMAAEDAANKRTRFSSYTRHYIVTREQIETGKVIL